MSTPIAEGPAYLLDHDWELEPHRLALLEHHADPTSARRLQATGLGTGWRCLEVRAGRGSIARWLEDPDYRGLGFTWVGVRGRRLSAC